ncbi:nudix hydrolase 2 [Eucalyptus grandis]|uniref:nudix hydrolase 2 n=1 Tax=Eucalyptus grandis TaxID=71139 RepID=UPI00192EB0CF|nr:nudix hydrolase 2 [Eucalyptus grandis]
MGILQFIQEHPNPIGVALALGAISISVVYIFKGRRSRAKLLSYVEDDYGGVKVEMKEAMDSATFVSMLRASISHWREQGKKGVWIKLPIELVNLVEPAVAEGFWYHHAEPKYLMLVYWIPQSAHTIPANASHRVSVGVVVMNEKDELLVVQEKTGTFGGTGVWKFPTGVVDEGEDICAAAVREIKEETGIDAEFVEVLAFRQSHRMFFQKSGLFFVCLARPLSFDIWKQDSEIEAAQWMPFQEYAKQPYCQKTEVVQYVIEICSAKKNGKYSGFAPVPTTSSFSDQKSYLYLDSHFRRRQ